MTFVEWLDGIAKDSSIHAFHRPRYEGDERLWILRGSTITCDCCGFSMSYMDREEPKNICWYCGQVGRGGLIFRERVGKICLECNCHLRHLLSVPPIKTFTIYSNSCEQEMAQSLLDGEFDVDGETS